MESKNDCRLVRLGGCSVLNQATGTGLTVTRDSASYYVELTQDGCDSGVPSPNSTSRVAVRANSCQDVAVGDTSLVSAGWPS